MAVTLETVAELLEHREWTACAALVDKAMAEEDRPGDQKAFLCYARCRSLSNLERYSAALESGQRALILAEQAGDYDLLGRVLVELAWVQHKLNGMELLAVQTQRRYFDKFQHYGPAARRHYLPAMLNLGVYLRTAGQYEEALSQFQEGYQAALVRNDADLADRCRRYAAWEALRLGRLALAEQLIQRGFEYVQRHPDDDDVNAGHLLDLACLHCAKREWNQAAAAAIQAALRSSAARDYCARAFEILHRTGKATGDLEMALAAAIVAKPVAESVERHDLVNELRASVREIAIRDPAAVERLLGEMVASI